jgi:ferrous iron transport protein A
MKMIVVVAMEESKEVCCEAMDAKKESFTLIDAPRDTPLRIKAILGGEGIRRRLFCLGFHIHDLIELDSEAILRGPVLVKNLTADTTVALARGIAQKILVELAYEQK